MLVNRPRKISQGHCPAIIELKGVKQLYLQVLMQIRIILYMMKMQMINLQNIAKKILEKFIMVGSY